jgi:hypothetical protein
MATGPDHPLWGFPPLGDVIGVSRGELNRHISIPVGEQNVLDVPIPVCRRGP